MNTNNSLNLFYFFTINNKRNYCLKQPKYSICITNFNSIDTIKNSMDSILSKLDDRFEVVVSDNCSTDGSLDILEDYARAGRIKLIVERSSRGRGRQIAFENSKGEYIISGLDTDDKLSNSFNKFIDIYHQEHEGSMLSASRTVHIIPRKLVEEIGGWRDLQWGEDIDFHKRAINLAKHHELQQNIELIERGKNERSISSMFYEQFNASICCYRIGKKTSDQVSMANWRHRPIVFGFAVFTLIYCKIRRIKKLTYSQKKQ
jgi:glycosyltransferase involved in cell wall biosynthesis